MSGGLAFHVNPNQPDFTWAAGQDVEATGSGNVLTLAAVAVNGSQASQSLTLNFTDGSSTTWTQSFSDWRNGSSTNNLPPSGTELASAGEAVVAVTNVINQVGNQVGNANKPARAFVYGYSFDLTPYAGMTLESITLPNNSNVGILGMALV